MSDAPSISVDALTQHQLPVPIKHLSPLVLFFKEEEFNLTAISDLISKDVALALCIMSYVNKIKDKSGRDYVVNIESAVNLIGINKVKEIIQALPVLEKSFQEKEQLGDYYALMQIIQHATFHSYQWAVARKDNSPKEVHMATLLSLVSQCYLCLYEYPLYKKIRQRVCNGDESFHGAANQILGINFAEFSMNLCRKLFLPGLVVDSLDPKMHEFYRPMGIMIALELAMQASLGWYHKGMLQTLEVASDYLAQPFALTVKMIHQKAVEYSQYEFAPLVFPVAAGLITLKTGELELNDNISAKPEAEKVNYLKIAAMINSSLNKEAKTPVDTLRLGVKQIYQSLGLKRVVLALINKQSRMLRFNIVLGDVKDSAFSHYETPIDKKSFFSLLIKKPQSAHIANKLYTQYSTLIPGDFKKLSGSQDFLVMSLFNGKNPMGMIWADNKGEPVSKEQFMAFKLVVANINKHILNLRNTTAK